MHASGTTGGLWERVPGLFVDGLGMGLVIAPLTHAALAGVPAAVVGSARYRHALGRCLAFLLALELLLAALTAVASRRRQQP
ncbi:hypothetical protein V2S66_10165 [Streptomyces sp. V4-01]|uniref:Uncharacterized protein n=1 Tax=Actinacidiphila polyblastidii TaxID=3110430 RepID=A0ABU7P954_9ACTN|nr:hypothetical protein [Streptomyces sp. V4-01]